ncbi:hypothetical protein SAMD00019534_111230, partial [Acytostelium subglobosum LB1]|uniref:hypothetical protein n=1 Tax=Acytostelium subglobosum LB1 TaxID=1410327 RepID=UPI0006447E9C
MMMITRRLRVASTLQSYLQQTCSRTGPSFISLTGSRHYITRNTPLTGSFINVIGDNGTANSAATMLCSGRAKKGGGGGKSDKKDDVVISSVKDVDLTAMKQACDATIDFIRRGYGNIRCGRAGPELLDLIQVETPNGTLPLNQVAMVTVKDALTLHLTLFDPTLLKYVEKALQSRSDLGMSPQVQGQMIKLAMPKPTQELRQTLIKSANNLAETAKVSIRRHRKDAADMVKKSYKFTKDDEKTVDKNIQKITDDYIATLTKLNES